MRSRAIVAVLALVLWPGAARADTIDELASRVESAIEAAQSGLTIPSPELMERVRDTVGLPSEVNVAGRTVTVAEDPLLARLAGETRADFEVAIRRLQVLHESIASTTGVVPPPSSELRRDLEAVSASIESAEPGLIERIRRFVESLLSSLVRRGVGALRGGPAWVALTAALALVLIALWRLRGRAVPLAAVRGRRGSLTAVEWRTRAEEAQVRGDLTGAVVALYGSLVAGLAERGLVEDRPSLTAGEIRTVAAAGAPRIATSLRDATRRYERVRYGMATATEDDLRALLEAERGARAA